LSIQIGSSITRLKEAIASTGKQQTKDSSVQIAQSLADVLITLSELMYMVSGVALREKKDNISARKTTLNTTH